MNLWLVATIMNAATFIMSGLSILFGDDNGFTYFIFGVSFVLMGTFFKYYVEDKEY